jgi:hypothetical protein
MERKQKDEEARIKALGAALSKERGVVVSRRNNKKRGHMVQEDVELYVRQLLDPFSDLGGVVPDVHSYPTTSFSVSTPIAITTDANGRFALFVRDGITYHYIRSNDGTKADGLAYSAGGTTGWSFAGGSSKWSAGGEAVGIRDTMSSYRPVAMGVRLLYDGAPVNAAGRLAFGLMPGGMALPMINQGDATYGVTFDEFAQYQETLTGAAVSGCTVTWRPMTPQNHFRPTKPYFYDGSTNDVYTPMLYDTSNLGSIAATWDTDTEICGAMCGLGYWTDEQHIAVPGTLTVSTMESASKFNALNIPMCSPMICIMGEGLPATTQALAGEIVVQYEGISDNRSFSLVRSNTNRRRHTPGAVETAFNQVSTVNPGHAGGSIRAHQDWLGKAIHISTQIANTAGSVASIVNAAPKVVQPLLEAAETVAALF